MAYHGPPIQLEELLYQPDHSIIKQSTDVEERSEPLNGDRWGVGWYEPEMTPEPAVYREVRPAERREHATREPGRRDAAILRPRQDRQPRAGRPPAQLPLVPRRPARPRG